MRQPNNIWSGVIRFRESDRGNTIVSFALAFPLLAGAAGVALDYAGAATMRSKMQAIADAAAVYAAREFQMVQANVEKVSAVASNYARQIEGVSVGVKVDTTALTVQVTLDKDVQNVFGQLGCPCGALPA